MGWPHGQADHTGLTGLVLMTGVGDYDDRRGGSSLVLRVTFGLHGLDHDSGLLLRERSGRELDADVGLAVAGAGYVARGRVHDGHGLRRRRDRFYRHRGLRIGVKSKFRYKQYTHPSYVIHQV